MSKLSSACTLWKTDVYLLVIQGPKERAKKSDDDALAWLPQLRLTSWPEDFPLVGCRSMDS